jgi:uncharacterized protein YdaU (DUF1376 family)
MHYYNFNIGDYISHTRHLTVIEDCAYRRLLDLYYLHEQPLDERSTVVARAINMREHEAEVLAVLNEFFVLVDGAGWVNQRCDEEISRYQNKLEAASRAGKASAARRLIERSTDVQPTKKQEPITKNQETKKDKAPARPGDVSEQVWNDFLQQRKQVKAPVTETALAGIQREAAKAGWSLEQALTECTVRGWRGFKADWVNKPGQNKQPVTDWGTMEDL